MNNSSPYKRSILVQVIDSVSFLFMKEVKLLSSLINECKGENANRDNSYYNPLNREMQRRAYEARYKNFLHHRQVENKDSIHRPSSVKTTS